MITKTTFKTRISHFAEDRYTVDYSHYKFLYIFRIWHSLHFWFEQTLTGGTECWSLKLPRINEAEELAMSIKSKEDVDKYYKPHNQRERDFYIRKKEYYNNSVPFKQKYY